MIFPVALFGGPFADLVGDTAFKMQIKRRLSRDNTDEPYPRSKRARIDSESSVSSITSRPPPRDIISSLPSEILVRIFSYLNETTLLGISPVSRLFRSVASDQQLWRLHYYQRFIIPKRHSIPGSKKTRKSSALGSDRDPLANTKASNTSGSAPHSSEVDWLSMYTLHHNWSKGQCTSDELQLSPSKRTPIGQTYIKVIERLVITADATSGLVVWDLHTLSRLAEASLGNDDSDDVRPTCLTVDDESLCEGQVGIAAGFEDGTFGIWRFDLNASQLRRMSRSSDISYGELRAIAYCHPYFVTASKAGSITFWMLEPPLPAECEDAEKNSHPSSQTPLPYMLRSLKAHSMMEPLTLSMRRVGNITIASIAYTLLTVSGWCIGIQDLDIRPSNVSSLPDITDSRLAHTTPTSPAASSPESPSRRFYSLSSTTAKKDTPCDQPIRLCYNHPYLLATLPDNTLLLYLCTTTPNTLSISSGIRLWGHTSGISDAEISRGKAISVSARGYEIRIWGLEGRVKGSSIEVKPKKSDGEARGFLSSALEAGSEDLNFTKHKVGFNDEMVIVLKEALDGSESLVVYDFT